MSAGFSALILAQFPVKQEDYFFSPTTEYSGDLGCGYKYETAKLLLCINMFNLKVLQFYLCTLRMKLISILTNPRKYV